MNFKIGLIAALAVLLSACQIEPDPVEEEKPVEEETPGGVDSGDFSPIGAVELDGTWETTCIVFDDMQGEFEKASLTITGTSYTYVRTIYSDDECGIEVGSTDDRDETGEISVGANMTTTSGTQGTDIDFRAVANGQTTSMNYDIYHIQGFALYMGQVNATLDGSTSAARPDTLNFDRPFNKMP